MKKYTVMLLIFSALLLVGGGAAYVVRKNSDDLKEAEHSAMMKKDEESKAMKAKEAEVMAKDAMKKEEVTPSTDSAMMHKSTGYVTLADYQKDTSKYTDSKKVYFFHASWCPICQSIDKAITADPSKIPSDTVIIKTDYDNNTALRQQYGVTYQYTFVQFDNSGSQQKKWSASDYDKVISGII